MKLKYSPMISQNVIVHFSGWKHESQKNAMFNVNCAQKLLSNIWIQSDTQRQAIVDIWLKDLRQNKFSAQSERVMKVTDAVMIARQNIT